MIKDQLMGLKIVLENDVVAEKLHFAETYVFATVGNKDGDCAAPILDCEYVEPDSVIVKGPLTRIQLTDIRVVDDTLKANRNGIAVTYKIIIDNKNI